MEDRDGLCKEAGQLALHPMAEARIWLELGSQLSWRCRQHPEACFCVASPSIPIQDLRWGGKNLLPLSSGDRAEVMDGSWARQIWGRYGE